MAFCPECGKTVLEGAKFCPNCGHQLGSSYTVQLPISKSVGTQTLGILGLVMMILGVLLTLGGAGGQVYCEGSMMSGCFQYLPAGNPFYIFDAFGILMFLVGVVLLIVGRKK